MHEPVNRPKPPDYPREESAGVLWVLLQLVRLPRPGVPAQFSVRNVYRDPTRGLNEANETSQRGGGNLSLWRLDEGAGTAVVWGRDAPHAPLWVTPDKPLACDDPAWLARLTEATAAYIANGGPTVHLVFAGTRREVEHDN